MALSTDDVAALSRLLDDSEGIDAEAHAAWQAALPEPQQHLVPLLREMLAAARCGEGAWPLPPLVCAAEPAGTEGAQIGPYRLLRRIGDGGMGSVWLAERADGTFERRVALKLPRLPVVSRVLAERMALERRIGARLEHPHIARLYDAGVDAAQRSYIAFEYIDGEPFDAWCAGPGRDVRQVLRTFVQIARAVAYAHRQLVVHRDIKPANILVDAQGRAFLLDFGIAKLLQEVAPPLSAVTREHGVAMTRRYASPEQVAGTAVGTASDVYSLGVTLYEALTAASPYAVARDTEAALEEAILLGSIAPASTRARDPRLKRELRGDLDAILWQALQLKPEQRYLGADAMTDDIERFLAGLPLGIRPARWFDRSRRLARRHRTAVLGSAAVVAALAVGLTAFALQARRLGEQAERTRLVTDFTAGLFRLQALPSSLPVDAARTGLTALDPVVALIELRFAGRADLQAELYGAIARVYLDIGVGSVASALAQRQVDVLQRSAARATQVARAHLLQAAADELQGRPARAEQSARTAVAALPGARSEAGLEARAALAALLLTSGRAAEARRIFAAVADADALATDRQPATVARARMLEARGMLLEIENRFDDAVATWSRAVAAAVAAEGPASRTASRIRLRLAAELLWRNRLADARSAFDLAVAALDNQGDSGRLQAAVAASEFAAIAFTAGMIGHTEALAMLDAARATAAAWAAVLPAQVLANIDVNRGVIALRRQSLALAAQTLEPAVRVARAATDSPLALRWLAAYEAALAMAGGRHDRADGLLQQRIALRIRAGDGATPFAAYDWVQWSHNAVMQGDLAKAESILQQAPAFQALSGDVHAGGQAYRHAVDEQRVRIHLRRGDIRAALAAMPVPYGLEAAEDRSEPTLAPYALRGELLCAAGDAARGLPFLQASIDAVAPVLDPAAPALARLRALAGRCALQAGDRVAAARLAALAGSAFRQQPGVSGWYRLPLAALESGLRGGAAAAPATVAMTH